MNKNLNLFINSVFKQKKLQFLIDEIQIGPSLFENGILKIENDKIRISDYKTVSIHFIEKYKQKFNFSIGESFEKNAEFISDVEKDFKGKRFISEYLLLEKEIWKLIVKESNSNYECSFSDYLKSMNPDDKPDGVYQFMEAYSILLPELKLSENEIISNFLILEEITKSEAEYNIDLGNVLNGIRNLSKSNYNCGLKLLKKSIDVQNRNDILISAVITGLYENRAVDFFKSVLAELLLKEENRNPIFFGLSKISNISEPDCKLLLELIEQYKDVDTLTISVLSLVFTVLRSDHASYHQFCFSHLELAVENENAAYFILRNLNLQEFYSEEQTKIIVKLINQDYFSIEKYMSAIAHVFWYLKDFDCFKKIILSVLHVFPFKDFIGKLQNFLHTVDKEKVDVFMINLLTDNAAEKRFTGLEIFNEMSRHNPYRFTFDILALPPLLQYKLWVVLTGDFHQPKDRLTALLPLLDSKSELIKESFLCKLEELSEDFGGNILNVLEENLDTSNLMYSSMIERIKNYISNFYDINTNVKNSLKELNPYHTHFKHINTFNNFFHKNMGKTINKGARENSFLSIIGTKTVQLSKGGGWRFGNNKEIGQLSSFGTSFTMPRSYFVDPNQYDMEKGVMIRQDWKDEEFAEIKKLLESEQ